VTTTKTKMTAAQRKVRNLRRTAGGTFYITAIVTASANAYASAHTLIGITIGLWTPMAFFLSLELIECIPVRKGALSWARLASIGFLALIAGWVSYWHLVEVLEAGGVTDPVAKYLMPLTVDILMAIARGAMNHKVAPSRPSVRRKAQPSNVRQLRSKTA
jgi:hypothetical protein